MQKMNSNTTLVKVKYVAIGSSLNVLKNSNTTLVKVKLFIFLLHFHYKFRHSNTTLVKVKCILNI